MVHGLFLPKDIHAFKDGTDESLGRRLQWHTIVVISYPLIFYLFHTHIFFSFLYSSLLLYQAAQLTHIIDGKLKGLSKDTEREKALKDVVKATVKEKVKAVETTKKKAAVAKKARALAESKSVELEVQLGGTELKLAEA